MRLFEAYRRVLKVGGIAVIVTSCMEDECKASLEARFDTVESIKADSEIGNNFDVDLGLIFWLAADGPGIADSKVRIQFLIPILDSILHFNT